MDIECGEMRIVFYSEKEGVTYDYTTESKELKPEAAFKQYS